MSVAIGNLITTVEVARRLGVSPGRVRQFASEGRLTPERKIGTLLFFDREVVEDFANTPRHTGRPKQAS